MTLLSVQINIRSFFLVALLCVSGCATTEPVKERFFWPPPPDVARIEWLKAFSSQLDIEQNTSQKFWAAIAGDDNAISLAKPVEVKSFPERNIFYVSDIGKSAVMVFDLEKRELRKLQIPSGIPSFTHPLSIAIDKNNNLFVLDRRSSSVFVFDSSEKFQRSIDLKAVSIANPVTMAIDRKNDRLYISDASSRKIVVIGLDGTYKWSLGGGGDADGQFNLPIAIAINSKGNIIVADAFSANVQIFNPEGRFERKFGRRGDGVGDFQLIKSVAVDSNDNIYVVDGRSHTVIIFNESGELLLSFGGYYAVSESGKVAPGGFALPIAIDIDATDKIYVVDQMNGRVQVFQYLSDAYKRRQAIK